MNSSEDLKKGLQELESPFSWYLPDSNLSEKDYIKFQTEKLQNIEEESVFKWNKLILNLVLSYEVCEKLGDHEVALKHNDECRELVTAARNAECNEYLFCSVQSVLDHVIQVTKAHILLASGQYDQAKMIMGKLQPLKTEDPKLKPGLLGLKAAIYLQYSPEGHETALDLAREACKLDEKQAEWWFIRGNALGRLKRNVNGLTSDEEIDAIEKANQLNKDASYIVHLAQLYSDLSNQQFFDGKVKEAKSYSEKSVEIFMEAIKMRPNCATLKARVVHGLLHIHDRQVMNKERINEVKQLLNDLEQTWPNNAMVQHDLGFYYNKYEKDYKKAIDYFKKSTKLGNIKALGDIIIIKWKQGLQDQIIQDLEEIVYVSNKGIDHALLCAWLGVCHILITEDWICAIKYFKKSLEIDPSGKCFKRYMGFTARPVNFLEMIVDYINRNFTEGPDHQYKLFINFVAQKKPEVLRKTSQSVKYNFESWKEDQLKVRGNCPLR